MPTSIYSLEPDYTKAVQLFIDKNRLMTNLKILTEHRPAHVKVRLSTKSIRCPDLLRKLADVLGERCSGLMLYHPGEISLCVERSWRRLLVAYPHLGGLRVEDFRKVEVTLMVDRVEHLEALREFAKQHSLKIRVMIDIDVATRFPSLHFGVRRSSLRETQDILNFICTIKSYPELQWVGIMSYPKALETIFDFMAVWVTGRISSNRIPIFVARSR